MTAVLAVLKILGLILLALLALLLLVLALPATVDVLFEKGVVTAGVRLFGIRIALLPSKKKAAPKAAKKARKPQTEATLAEEPAAAPSGAEQTASAPTEDTAVAAAGAVQQLKTYLDPAKRGVRFLLRHMRLHDVTFVFNARSADAAEVGMRCGIMWSFVGGLMRTLAFLFGERVKYGEVTVMPCFHPNDGARERFGCKITASPIIIVIAAAVFWRQFKKSNRSSVQ